jgi:hypothetical protein
MLIKIFIIYFLILLNIKAEQITLKYDVRFGLFGEVGDVIATLKIKDSKYKIEAKLLTTGFVKSITKGRYEVYTSEGKVLNNKLIPLKYTKLKYSKKKYSYTEYLFNHKDQEIRKKSENNIKKYLYYSKDDLLTLFINNSQLIRNLKLDQKIILKAVGAHKENGTVNITKIDRNKFTITINQKIFSSKQGELIIVMNNKNIWQKILLKNVLLLGDIEGKLKNR